MIEQKNKKPRTLEEIKREKGGACWAYLIAEEKNQQGKRRAVDFGVIHGEHCHNDNIQDISSLKFNHD